MVDDAQVKINTFAFVGTKEDGSFTPDRIIISKSESYPKIFTLKVIGENLFALFSSLLDSDKAKAIGSGIPSQIIGAISVFKINPDIYASIVKNADLSDMNVVVDSSKNVYGIIKRFVSTNPENFDKALNEVMAYVDTYIKVQLAKYNITDNMFVNDTYLSFFIFLSGKQKQYVEGLTDLISKQVNNVIIDPEVKQPEVKKGFFSFLHRPKSKTPIAAQQQQVENPKPQQQPKASTADVDAEISKLEKKLSKPEKRRGFFSAVLDQWKEEAWEKPEDRERREKAEYERIKRKLDLEKQKVDLIKAKKSLKEKPSNSNSNAEDDSDEE